MNLFIFDKKLLIAIYPTTKPFSPILLGDNITLSNIIKTSLQARLVV